MKTRSLIAFVLAVAVATPVLARGGGGMGGGMGGGGMGGGMGGGFGGMGGGMGGGFGGMDGGMGGRGGGMGGRGGMGGMGGMGGINIQNFGGTTPNNVRTNPRTTNTTATPTNSNARGARTTAAGPTAALRSGRGTQIQLSNDYAILDTTSIFAQNRRALSANEIETPEIVQPPVFRGASPVVRAAMIDDLGPLALLEVQQRDGSLASVYVRKGDTVEYNNAKVLDVTLAYLRLSRASTGEGSNTYFDIPLGRNLDGQISGALPATLVNQSLDALGAQQNQNFGGRNRGNRGGGGGNFGGNNNNFNNYGGGLSALVGGGTTAVSITNTIVNPNLDPPLPPGSNDDIAARMAARRQQQVNSSSTPTAAPAATPTATPAAAPATKTGG